MGNESSRGGGGGASTKKGIITVRDGTEIKVEDPNDDVNLKRLQEMPRFLPIRGTVFGKKDTLDYRAISPQPIMQLSLRLSNHFSLCAKAVSTKQTNISNLIKSVEARSSSVAAATMTKKKRLDKLVVALQKVSTFSEEIQRIHLMMDAMKPVLKEISSVLPAESRPPPLSLGHLAERHQLGSSSSSSRLSSATSTPSHRPAGGSSSRDSPRIVLPPIEEIRVVDQVVAKR